MKSDVTIVAVLVSLGAPVWAADPPVPAESAGPIEFKFTFEPGRTYAQRVVSKSVGSITLPLPGPVSEQKFSQVFEQTLTSTCRKVNADRSGVFDVVIGNVGMRMSIGGFKMEYDSRTFDPDSADVMTAMLGKVMGAMNGAGFTLTVSEAGQPMKVEGLAASMKKAMDRLASEPDAAQMRQFMNEFAKLMDDTSMNEQMQSFYRMSPGREGPLKIGDKWSQTWSMTMPLVGGSFQGRGDYELVGIEEVKGRKCAKIRLKESFKIQPGAQGSPEKGGGSAIAAMLKGMEMELSTSGGDGIAHIDYQRGELVQLRQTQNLTMVMKIPITQEADEPADPGNEVPPLTMKIRSSVSIDPVEPGADRAGSATTGNTAPAGTR